MSMTTFAELESLVIEQTRRPEISSVTKAAIRTATLRAHHTDFFPRDLASGPLTYTLSSIAQFYDFPNISQTLLRLRSLKLIHGIDAVTSVPVEQLEFREADDLFDADGNRRPHIYTLVGDTLRIYFSAPTGAATAFFYQNPQTSEAQYSSWIADTYPDELAAWAAGIVFARTGFTEMAQQFQELHVRPFKELLISSHLLGNVS
jgi:hypothetical protein